MLPVAFRALTSRNGLPCWVRRSRTEVTATISHTSSDNGSSGMGILPFMFRKLLVSEFGNYLIKSGPDKITRQRKGLSNSISQGFERSQHRRNRILLVWNAVLDYPPGAERAVDRDQSDFRRPIRIGLGRINRSTFVIIDIAKVVVAAD